MRKKIARQFNTTVRYIDSLEVISNKKHWRGRRFSIKFKALKRDNSAVFCTDARAITTEAERSSALHGSGPGRARAFGKARPGQVARIFSGPGGLGLMHKIFFGLCRPEPAPAVPGGRVILCRKF